MTLMTETVPFRELIQENKTLLKSYMNWENYELNDKVLPVVEDLKEHALFVLEQNYGRYQVSPEIVDELIADVFVYFPPLMQQLAISRLMDAYSVPEEDTETETMTRAEETTGEVQQNSELTLGTQAQESEEQNTQQATTGTVSVAGSTENTQSSNTTIENTSGVAMTGNRSVNLTHNMPEQALVGGTGNFPTDPEGTPILSSAYTQTATENFNTHNPIDSEETSEQTSSGTSMSETNQTTTNDVTVANTGTNTRTVQNSGSDTSQSNTSNEETKEITETRSRTMTNKQYAYEIKAFLESVEVVNAFENWANRFSWVVGII